MKRKMTRKLPTETQGSRKSAALNKKAKLPEIKDNETVRIIPIGGLDEVGKNMMLFETKNDIVIIDMGFQFPEKHMLGIDYILPDVNYLEGKKEKIRGIVLTHGHLDHIGGIPFLIERLGFPPIYGTKLTCGLVQKNLREFGLLKRAKIHSFDPDDTLSLGAFKAQFFRVNHSIPDAVGIVLDSPAGKFVHTGDFKFDFTPAADQKPADFKKIASLGGKNVVGLFSDSTNAMRPGHTMSEQEIAKNLEKIIKDTPGRLIIAVFASLLARIQQICDFADKHGRKVYVSGRSMQNYLEIAKDLGFLKYKSGLINDVALYKQSRDEKVIILTTGSQGEDAAALSRITRKEHKFVKIKKGDTVVISATPIIGNEKSVVAVINNLARQGAHVIHHKMMDIHTSGHACQEDLKLMINLVKPKYLVPVHGEYHMRQAHKWLGLELGMSERETILVENGHVLEARRGAMKVIGQDIDIREIYVDGLGVGIVGSEIICDRKTMSENGVLVILFTLSQRKKLIRTDVISRGFIYKDETDSIAAKLSKEAKKVYQSCSKKDPNMRRGLLKELISRALEKKTHRLLERKPLIIPIIADIGGEKEYKKTKTNREK